MNIIKKSYYKLGAVLTTGLVLGVSESAHAQTGNNFNAITSNINESISDLPGMVSGIAYLFGLLLGVLGILKVKDHVEQPTQHPLKDGAIRIAAGGALFALPIVMEAMLNTIGSDGDAVSVQELRKVDFAVSGN